MTSKYFGRVWRFQVAGISSETLDMEFEIRKSLRHEPNACQLKVYGLSSDHRRQVESLNTYDPKKTPREPGQPRPKRPTGRQPKTGKIPVSIWAGYKDTGRGLIFSGDLRRGISSALRPETMLEVQGEDGGKSFLESRINETFPPGTTKLAVVEACLEALGLGTGNILAVAPMLRDRTYPSGTVLAGPASDLLKSVLRGAGYTYSIQNGGVQILGAGRGLEVSAYPLSSDTGLIGAPERDATGAVVAETLMLANLFPGAYVQIKSVDAKVSGLYFVKSMVTRGDTAGSSWGHTLELSPG